MAETMEEFLARRHIAALGTHNKSGSIQLSAVWYLHDDGSIYVPTSAATVKGRNVRERPAASVLIDSREPGGAVKTASGAGPAEALGGAEAAAMNRRVFDRYMSADAMADPSCGGDLIENDTVCIRVTPERWNWIDISEAFGGILETPGYMLPLGE